MRSGAITVRPSGFFQPEAILARNLFGATPAEIVSCVASRTCCLSRRATFTPSGSSQAFSVTSRYASSIDSGSTSGVTARNSSKTVVDTRLYFDMSGRTTTSCGQLRSAARHRHRRADAERARLVAGRGDDAALADAAADDDRLAAQARVVALLDRRVECVHVEMEDAPQGHGLRSILSRDSPFFRCVRRRIGLGAGGAASADAQLAVRGDDGRSARPT